MQHNKLKRGTSLFLAFVICFFTLSVPSFASDSPSGFIDVTPSSGLSHSGPFDSVDIHPSFPSWLSSSGYYDSAAFFVIGEFNNCLPSAWGSSSADFTLVSSNGNLKVYYINPAYATHFFIRASGSSPSYKIYHVYASIPVFDFTLSSLYYGYSDYADLTSNVSFSSISVPRTVGSASYHYLRIPRTQLTLADSVTFDFMKYLSSSDPQPTLDVAVFSGSQQIGYQLSEDDQVYTISVSELNPNFDLFIRISFSSPMALSIDSVSIRYGLVLSEVDLLSKLNDSLNSNFDTLESLLNSQTNVITNGFASIGQWFADLSSELVTRLKTLKSAVTSGFSDLGTWITNQTSSIGSFIQAQTNTLAGKLDELINGTAAQQQAVQQQQQINQNLQTNINNANNSLQQAGSSLSAVSKPSDVNMSLDGLGVDYSSLIMLTSPITGDSLIGPIMGLLAVLMLLSYVIFGRKG